MKIVAIALALLLSAGTLYAQVFPLTKTLEWNANPATDAVSHYTVLLNGVSIGQPAGTCTPLCSIPFTLPASGQYTLSVTATNQFGTSIPTTLSFNATKPGNITGLKIR